MFYHCSKYFKEILPPDTVLLVGRILKSEKYSSLGYDFMMPKLSLMIVDSLLWEQPYTLEVEKYAIQIFPID